MSKKMDIDKYLTVDQIKEQHEYAENDERIDHAIEIFEEIKEESEKKPNFEISKIRVDRDLYYPIPTKEFQSCLTFPELEDWKESVVVDDWKALARRELFIDPEIETEKIIPNVGYYELEFELKECEDCSSKPLYDSNSDNYYCPVCG